MNENRAFAIWAAMNPRDQDEAIKLIVEFKNASPNRQAEMRRQYSIGLESLSEESFRKSTTMNFGPLGGTPCPKCGKI